MMQRSSHPEATAIGASRRAIRLRAVLVSQPHLG
jgi:hypothetical protein